MWTLAFHIYMFVCGLNMLVSQCNKYLVNSQSILIFSIDNVAVLALFVVEVWVHVFLVQHVVVGHNTNRVLSWLEARGIPFAAPRRRQLRRRR